MSSWGLVSGLVASAFTYGLYTSEDLWDGLKIPEYVKPAVGGLLIGCMGIYYHPGSGTWIRYH